MMASSSFTSSVLTAH